MSGGAAVKAAAGSRGITRSARTPDLIRGRKTGDTPRLRPKGLALTAPGAQPPTS
jgi:hypothetical protein